MGEKGNVVDPGAVVSVAGPSVIEHTSSVISSTVVQSVDTLRDKAISVGESAINEARDRLKERRDAERSAHDDSGPELPPPPSSTSPS